MRSGVGGGVHSFGAGRHQHRSRARFTATASLARRSGRPGRRPSLPAAPRASRRTPVSLIFPYLFLGSGGYEWPGASLDTIRRRIAHHNSSERVKWEIHGYIHSIWSGGIANHYEYRIRSAM